MVIDMNMFQMLDIPLKFRKSCQVKLIFSQKKGFFHRKNMKHGLLIFSKNAC